MEFKKKTQIKMGIYYKETSFMTAKQLLSAGKCVLLFIFVI